jgi:hypothetical protein
VGDGDSVMLDADTTTSMLARSGTELSLVPAIERRI